MCLTPLWVFLVSGYGCETLSHGHSKNPQIFGLGKQKPINYNPCHSCKLETTRIVTVNETQVLAAPLFYQGI